VCEYEIGYGVEVYMLNGAWKETNKVHRKFCEELAELTNCAASGFSEMEIYTVNLM
jgi:hypothetical protein